MSPHRRLITVLVVLAALAVPAIALRAACVGASCDAGPPAPRQVPFCGLPADVRALIGTGYREGRSPDVLAVTAAGATVVGPTETANGGIPWPRVVDGSTDAPLAIWRPGGERMDLVGTTLDRVAPTLAAAMGLDRPFPDVRSGTALSGIADGPAPRLVLVIAWKGVGTSTLDDRLQGGARSLLRGLLHDGAGSLRASTGSLPVEPAAVLTTLGIGALPRQHGVTGPVVRDDAGAIVPAYGAGAPTPVLASLGDDVRHLSDGLVAMAAADPLDAGLVGTGWYAGQGAPPVAIVDTAGAVAETRRALDAGFGADEVPDLFAVSLDDDLRTMDTATSRIVDEAGRATDGSILVVIAGTGAAAPGLPVSVFDDAIGTTGDDLVEAVVAGGWFLDQDALRATGRTSDDVAEAAAGARDEGAVVTEDVFQDFSISFDRYC